MDHDELFTARDPQLTRAARHEERNPAVTHPPDVRHPRPDDLVSRADRARPIADNIVLGYD